MQTQHLNQFLLCVYYAQKKKVKKSFHWQWVLYAYPYYVGFSMGCHKLTIHLAFNIPLKN